MRLGGLVDKILVYVVTGSIPAMEHLFFFFLLTTPIHIYAYLVCKGLSFHYSNRFISKQTFWLLYSSLHQCNAELQITKTDILIKQSLEIWVHSHMAPLPSVVRLWLEMVKGNHSMIKSYISDRVPLSLLRYLLCNVSILYMQLSF